MAKTARKPTPSTIVNRTVPRRAPNSELRPREYLTEKEIERLQEAARKRSRYGHRDATMILITYRHGLRASELCGLRWDQIDLNSGRLHVRRAKGGIDNVHPLSGKEIRALRQLRRENMRISIRFRYRARWSGHDCGISEDDRPNRRSRQAPISDPPAHASPLHRLQACQRRARYPSTPTLHGPQKYHAHGSIYRNGARSVQEFLEGLMVVRQHETPASDETRMQSLRCNSASGVG